jgi:hypothetical protein
MTEVNPVTLITPYFRTSSDKRQKEFELCLQKNVANHSITKIVLLIDDDTVPPINDEKIVIRYLRSRPTYREWVELISTLRPKGSVILANTDIYFDDSVSRIGEVLSEKHTFMALTRWDLKDSEVIKHPNPQWSQDAWAISADSEVAPNLISRLGFALGVPRCDNKVAYVFATGGWKVCNPCHYITSTTRAKDSISTTPTSNSTSISSLALLKHH